MRWVDLVCYRFVKSWNGKSWWCHWKKSHLSFWRRVVRRMETSIFYDTKSFLFGWFFNFLILWVIATCWIEERPLEGSISTSELRVEWWNSRLTSVLSSAVRWTTNSVVLSIKSRTTGESSSISSTRKSATKADSRIVSLTTIITPTKGPSYDSCWTAGTN